MPPPILYVSPERPPRARAHEDAAHLVPFAGHDQLVGYFDVQLRQRGAEDPFTIETVRIRECPADEGEAPIAMIND